MVLEVKVIYRVMGFIKLGGKSGRFEVGFWSSTTFN